MQEPSVWQFRPPARFGKKYGDAIKSSRSIHLYTYASLTEITANENAAAIEKLTVRNLAGKTHTVKARRVILACNTIQNARLLLAACPQAPKGLGNDHDLVGRHFMEHLEIQSAWLNCCIEQAPNPDSRITLMNERDHLGMPRAHLNWVLTPLEKHSIRTFYELLGRQVGQYTVGRIRVMDYLQDPADQSLPDFTSGGWHHMGTTRMSTDPRTGAVDPNCKVHGITNLFIVGGSCFVTAAAPNPTLTIVALSLRLSDHLKQLA